MAVHAEQASIIRQPPTAAPQARPGAAAIEQVLEAIAAACATHMARQHSSPATADLAHVRIEALAAVTAARRVTADPALQRKVAAVLRVVESVVARFDQHANNPTDPDVLKRASAEGGAATAGGGSARRIAYVVYVVKERRRVRAGARELRKCRGLLLAHTGCKVVAERRGDESCLPNNEVHAVEPHQVQGNAIVAECDIDDGAKGKENDNAKANDEDDDAHDDKGDKEVAMVVHVEEDMRDKPNIKSHQSQSSSIGRSSRFDRSRGRERSREPRARMKFMPRRSLSAMDNRRSRSSSPWSDKARVRTPEQRTPSTFSMPSADAAAQAQAPVAPSCALYDQAVVYARGADGVARNMWRAARLFRQASEGGDVRATCDLGQCYQMGCGVEVDEKEAVRLYQLAADVGLARAQSHLARCYAYGYGVTKDMKSAILLYEQASAGGNAIALCNLGACYQKGNGVALDLGKALALYGRSADQGYGRAWYNLGVCHESGLGVVKDMRVAIEMYERAGECGFATALCTLGTCYESGLGVTRDVRRAVRLFNEAAEGGCARAQFYLGQCFENGRGVDKDVGMAVALYRKAAHAGFQDALLYLKAFRNDQGRLEDRLRQLQRVS